MKKSTLLKLICIVLMSFMVLSIAACGGSRDTDTDTSGADENTVTLRFDLNGGDMDGSKTVKYQKGDKVKTLPEPVKEECTFLGWYTIEQDEVEEDTDTVIPQVAPFTIDKDLKLYAWWLEPVSSDSDTDAGSNTDTDGVDNSGSSDSNTDEGTSDTETETDTNEGEAPSKVTLTFNANGGEITNGTATKEATPGKNFALVPEAERDGYTFEGWMTEEGEIIEVPFVVPNVDTTYYAQWKKVTAGDTNTDTNAGSSDSDTSEPEGPTVTITLDVDGGTLPEGAVSEWEAVVGTKFGASLPTPTRPGYTFKGWFEDGDERYDITKKSEVEDYDMYIVALWEAKGEMVMIEFSLGSEETLEAGVEPYFEMVSGERISSFISKLPTAEKSGFKFDYWQDANGTKITVTSIITKDTVLTPVWKRVLLCSDGTENHQWNAWQQASEATCTEPAQETRTCNVCGATDYNVTQEAKGHKFGTWATTVTENGIVRSRVCVECEEKEADPLTNIAFDAFNTPVVDGSGWGTAKGANLFDGNYTDTPMCGDGTGAFTVIVEAKEAVWVDIFAVTGQGSAAYTVTVFYADGTSKELPPGSFGSGETATKAFTIEAMVTKFVVTMPNPSNGTDFWSEISILVVPKSE